MTLVTTTTDDGERNAALMQAVGFDRLNPAQRELALGIANRYGLDPMLKHLVMVEGKPYITRDGLLHVAHKSGQFDGIEVEAPHLDDDGSFWRTTAVVYRKDFSRPFKYPGRYPAKGGNARYAEEMCIKVAEVMCLRRAFDVAAPVIEERWTEDSGDEPITDDAPTTLVDRIAAKAATVAAPETIAEMITPVIPERSDPMDDIVNAGIPFDQPPMEPVSLEERAALTARGEVDPGPERPVEAVEATETVEDDAPEETSVTPTPTAETASSTGLTYTEFMELARAYDRDDVRNAAKMLFPDLHPPKFASLSTEQRQELIDVLAEQYKPTPPDQGDIVDPLFSGAPRAAVAPRRSPTLCGAKSPFSDATCTLDEGHKVPVANGINHRAGVQEAW